jgi:hypothetical protein
MYSSVLFYQLPILNHFDAVIAPPSPGAAWSLMIEGGLGPCEGPTT